MMHHSLQMAKIKTQTQIVMTYTAHARLQKLFIKSLHRGVEPRPPAWRASVLPQSQRGSFDKYGFDFKTTFHKNPQLTTTYRQEAPIAQYVCRIDAQIAVRFCAIC